jgi:hypothetical protein
MEIPIQNGLKAERGSLLCCTADLSWGYKVCKHRLLTLPRTQKRFQLAPMATVNVEIGV